MYRGYVKLWRRLLDSPIFTNEALLKIFIYCIFKMHIPPRDETGKFIYESKWLPVITGKSKTEVEIKPGQFLFGRQITAKRLRMNSSSVRNRFKKLENMRIVDIQSYPHYSLITVNDWKDYQGITSEKGQAKDRQRTPKGQAKDTKKNNKNIKNYKKEGDDGENKSEYEKVQTELHKKKKTTPKERHNIIKKKFPELVKRIKKEK